MEEKNLEKQKKENDNRKDFDTIMREFNEKRAKYKTNIELLTQETQNSSFAANI